MESLRIFTLMQPWHLAVLLLVLLPLTLLWAYAFVDCARGGPESSPSGVSGDATLASDSRAPLDSLTWAALLVLSGWFGALAYLAVIVFPRLTLTWRSQGILRPGRRLLPAASET